MSSIIPDANVISPQQRRLSLDDYYTQARQIILSRQDPISGLLPASTAVTVHGDYRHAWVRDNVYSILAVWGLALAYRRYDDDEGKTYWLEQSVVKLMRGLLTAMMKQTAKVEQFKHTQNPLDALHAKYHTRTGDPVVDDAAWGHLQLDATALFLLMLAQMTAAGLRIVFTPDEVDFIQNLVHYLGRAYHTPDYGIWERGHKMNEGRAEINASSVGMVKAALEVLNGFDLFGQQGRGDPASVIHVAADDIAQARNVLEALLPRESQSKETDAALLAVIGFPAYAVEDAGLVARTHAEIITKLQGRYGCKRFLRDGHQTVLEDHARLHYETGELGRFENIESEWPLFFTYLLLDGVLRGNHDQAQEYRQRLQALLVERDGEHLLPELYYVPSEHIEQEKASPGSQPRLPNDNIPLVWAQSLYLLGVLLQEGFIDASDIDPLGRRLRIGRRRNICIQMALLAETPQVKNRLQALDIETEIADAVGPVRVGKAAQLAAVLSRQGCNPALGLSGRPQRRPGSLVTNQMFKLNDEECYVFLPAFLERRDFYLNLDNHLLVARLQNEIAYLDRHWDQPGQPLLILLITEAMLQADDHSALLPLLKSLPAGNYNGIDIRVSQLKALIPAVSQIKLDARYVSDLQPPTEVDTGLSGSVRQLTEDFYERACRLRLWGIIRRAAGMLDKLDETLEDALADLVSRQHQLSLSQVYDSAALIDRPLNNAEIIEQIRRYGSDDPRERVLLQELVLYLGMLIKAEPELFKGMITLRTWHLLSLLNTTLAREQTISEDEAFDRLLELSPHALLERLRQIIANSNTTDSSLWAVWRETNGVLTRLPEDFHSRVWNILRHCRGLIIGNQADMRNRLDSATVLADTTPAERSFALRVEHLLNTIPSAQYRQLCIEALVVLSEFIETNPEFSIKNDVVLDTLIDAAVQLSWRQPHPTKELANKELISKELIDNENEAPSADAWDHFYGYSPQQVATAITKVLSTPLATADLQLMTAA